MTENLYIRRFVALCPNNAREIVYELRIKTAGRVIMAEDIVKATNRIEAFHEAIADRLYDIFGGRQVLTAYHHGVYIETVRE